VPCKKIPHFLRAERVAKVLPHICQHVPVLSFHPVEVRVVTEFKFRANGADVWVGIARAHVKTYTARERLDGNGLWRGK
jgi:hypothetical protein